MSDVADDDSYLSTVTANLRGVFPSAQGDNDVHFYDVLARTAGRTSSGELLRAHLTAQRRVLRVLASAAINAPSSAPGHTESDDAWWEYQSSLARSLAALENLLAAVGPSSAGGPATGRDQPE